VTGKMPGDSADDGPLQAAPCRSRSGISATPVTATAKAPGSSIAFI